MTEIEAALRNLLLVLERDGGFCRDREEEALADADLGCPPEPWSAMRRARLALEEGTP